MSNDIVGEKRPIDDIQDANDKGSDKVQAQDVNNEQGATNPTQSATPNAQRSGISKLQERQRGQRLFGMLMGTLNKFDKTEKQNEEQARKRQAIDTKHQERLLEEKKAIQASLLQRQQERAKEQQQRQADREEKRAKQQELQRKRLAHYLITTTAPQLSYLPKVLLPQQQEKIDRQVKDLETPTTTTDAQQETHQEQQDQEK